MNSYKLFLFLILFSLCVSCSNDDEIEVPVSETECTEDVSFNEDGSTITMPIGGLDNEGKALLELKDPSPFNPQGVSRAFALRMQSGLTIFDIVLELNVDNSDSCIPTGVYDTQTLDSSEGLLSFWYMKGFNSYVVGLGEGNGILEITKCDLENKLISGKFTCTMKEPLGSDVIQITEGEFENVCFTD